MDFRYSWAIERDGYWITNRSCSPENSYYIPEGMTVAGETTGIDAGAMNDRAIMWEIILSRSRKLSILPKVFRKPKIFVIRS